METALTVLVYVIASFLAILQGIFIWQVVDSKSKMKLCYLIADDGYDASMSRFQFLLFTFVIAVGFVYLTFKGEGFPEINEGVLILLGISGASYALGKGLDRQSPAVESGSTGGGGGDAKGGGGEDKSK